MGIPHLKLWPPDPMCAAECYGRNDWRASNVAPFPLARNRRRMDAVAEKIEAGRRGASVELSIEYHARRLYRAHVPRDLAERELIAFERELIALLDRRRARHG